MKRLLLGILMLCSSPVFAACPDGTAGTWSAAGTGTSITKGSVTWTFSGTVTCGLYANGDPWVVDGSWTIDSVAPTYDSTSGAQKNGMMSNPVSNGPQGFSNFGTTKLGNWDATYNVTLPYSAAAGESLVKAVTASAAGSCTSNGGCTTEIRVLTVVSSAPTGDGEDYFRPPFAGTAKPSYQVSAMRTDLLPQLAAISGEPTLAATAAIFNNVRMEMSSDAGAGDNVRKMRPTASYPNTATNYGPAAGTQNNKAILRMFRSDVTATTPALIYLVQSGIDSIGSMNSSLRWADGNGQEPGHLALILFAAAMVEDTAASATAAALTTWHEDRYLTRNSSDVAVFGSTQIYSWATTKVDYWNYLSSSTTSAERMDPYGYIDGGGRQYGGGTTNNVNGYQVCCLAGGPWKGSALILNLMPSLATSWPNFATFSEFEERWVTAGAKTLPDPCAAIPANLVGTTITTGTAGYGVTFGDNGSGGCIQDGVGRLAAANGLFVNHTGNYGDTWINSMWTAYYDNVISTPYSLTSVTPDTGTQNTSVPIVLVGAVLDGASPSITVSGAGVTSDTPVCATATSCTANLTITAGAAAGARNLTLTTAAGTTNAVTFTVVASTTPTLTSVSPSFGYAGSTVSYTLTGTNLNGGSEVVTSSSGSITILSTTVVNSTTITGQLAISTPNPIPGTLSVTTVDGTTDSVPFTVLSPPQGSGSKLRSRLR